MADYKKLSELYSTLDNLFGMQRDVRESIENLQTKDHIFLLDVSPRCNSRALKASKVTYKKELLSILDSEIKEIQRNILQLSSDK